MENQKGLFSVEVVSNVEISKGIFLLSVKRIHDFKAGQVIALTVNDGITPRLYSICSGEEDELLSILYNIVPEGELTRLMRMIKKGDTIKISTPFGNFLGTDDSAYWIAAGTGLAPFYAMFKSARTDNKYLIHGGRILESFYFQDELMKELRSRYVRCCSQQSGEGVYEGRLTNYLREKAEFPLDHKYYLCGSSEMVVQTRDILLSKNVPFENIIAEIYF